MRLVSSDFAVAQMQRRDEPGLIRSATRIASFRNHELPVDRA
jgi:hypothetical protein